jgi:hypothetical protein
MEKYDYRECVREDVMNYIKEHEIKVTTENRDEIQETLYDDMFISDSVTGNASGSYTFNAWRAEENICHNMDLLKDACDEFGCEPKFDSAEWCDVTIRCYLLGEVLGEVLDDIEEEVEEEGEYEEDEE